MALSGQSVGIGLTLAGLATLFISRIRSANAPILSDAAIAFPQPNRFGISRQERRTVNDIDGAAAAIAEMISENRDDAEVYVWCRQYLYSRNVKARDDGGELRALYAELRRIYAQIRNDVTYRSDPHGVDNFTRPGLTLKAHGGDCDDFTILCCVVLENLGYTTLFKVIKTKGSPIFDHIYAMVGVPKLKPTDFIAFDASLSERNAGLGREVANSEIDAYRVYNAITGKLVEKRSN